MSHPIRTGRCYGSLITLQIRWRLLAIVMLATAVSACPGTTSTGTSEPAPAIAITPTLSPTATTSHSETVNSAMDTPARGDGVDSPAAATSTHALLRAGGSPKPLDPKLEALVRSPQGRFALVKGPAEQLSSPGTGWHTLSLMGPGAWAKVRNPHPLMGQLEQQAVDDPIVSCFAKLDAKKLSGDQATVKRALAAIGFEARTVAGNIVTGSFTASALGRILASPWVQNLELPRRFKHH
jgi:hypothetical protein